MKKKMLAALLALALIIAGIAPSTLAFGFAAAGINSFVLPENKEAIGQTEQTESFPGEDSAAAAWAYCDELLGCQAFDALMASAIIYTVPELEDFFNIVQYTQKPGAENAQAQPEASAEYSALIQHIYELCSEFHQQLMACTGIDSFGDLTGAYSESQMYLFVRGLENVIGDKEAYLEHVSALAAAYVQPVSFTDAAPLLPPVGAPLKGFQALAAGTPEAKGIELKKTAVPVEGGKYHITMEAYATGETISTVTDETVPCDIILVVDQSGSMDETFSTAPKDAYMSYSLINNYLLGSNNLWYKEANGKFVRVSVTRNDKHYIYKKAESGEIIEESDEHNAYPKTTFYGFVTKGSNIDRRTALMFALNSFTDIIKQVAAGPDGNIATAGDNINHRIAMVGFATKESQYTNTELFIGKETYNYNNRKNGHSTSTTDIAPDHYGEAFQSMDDPGGAQNIKDSIVAIAADGMTYPKFGLMMAEEIFKKYPVNTGERRRVVIMFTDGEPDGKTPIPINHAKQSAKRLKEMGATIYTVGVIDGANPLNESDAPNDFMHRISSNYGTDEKPAIDPFPPTRADESYYLAANDEESLRNVFESIAGEISVGRADSALNSEAVIKDIVTEQFNPPTGAQITLSTAACTGVDAEGKPNQWADAVAADNTVTASVTGNTVSVTGFDYSANWCGTETGNIRGKKLIIQFDVTPKPGFLGGNNVPTNGDTSGVYANQNETSPLITFEVPTVDVPIPQPAIIATDKNVYLYGALTEEQLKAGAIATVGDNTITIKLDESDFGLEPWQYKFVNIIPTVSLGSFTDLTEDGTYTVSVAITPKTAGMATAKSASANGNINVFKPEITFADKEVWYGDNAVRANIFKSEEVKWKHGEAYSTGDGIVMSEANPPAVSFEYTPAGQQGFYVSAAASVYPIDFNTDKYVTVTEVKVRGNNAALEHTEFKHADCSIVPNCPFDANNGQFMLHVKTCELTVTKNAAQGTAIGENESFVFTVTNGNAIVPINLDVVVHGEGQVTIKGLPIGKYTVTEDSGWSWRYTLTDSIGNTSAPELKASLTAFDSHKTAAAYNKLSNKNWLNGEAHIDNRWKKKEGGGYEVTCS